MLVHHASSDILFVSICSRQKLAGGEAAYDAQASIARYLDSGLRARFLNRRSYLRRYTLCNRTFRWQGIPLREHEYNSRLTIGPDFGGQEPAEYRPALDRYDGRFFSAMGRDGRDAVRRSAHHTLILSGLYGVVGPAEPVQMYSCPVSPQTSLLWRENGLLTDVLLAYCQSHGISRVFDLTAAQVYREMVDWPRLAQERGITVLRCFNTRAAGDDALMDFGTLLGLELATASRDELLRIKPGTRIDGTLFASPEDAPPGLPQEDAARAPVNDPGAGQVKKKWTLCPTTRYLACLGQYPKLYDQIVQAQAELLRDPVTPRGDTIKPLAGDLKGCWRYRLGDYRLVYAPDRGTGRIRLEDIAPRGDVYRP